MASERFIAQQVRLQHREIAERVRSARLQASLTQSELAERAGLERKSVNRIENNQLSPTIDTLVRIAVVLGCTTSSLVEGR